MRSILDKQNKKGVSMMIGYVLLVSFAIITGVIVYNWLKTYVPSETIECPDGVSMAIRDVACYQPDAVNKPGNYSLEINLSNNGRYSVDGFYVRVTNQPEQELAIIDISKSITSGGDAPGNFVQFLGNSLGPSDRKSVQFFPIGKSYIVEVIPVRFEDVEGKIKLASCSSAKVREVLSCE